MSFQILTFLNLKRLCWRVFWSIINEIYSITPRGWGQFHIFMYGYVPLYRVSFFSSHVLSGYLFPEEAFCMFAQGMTFMTLGFVSLFFFFYKKHMFFFMVEDQNYQSICFLGGLQQSKQKPLPTQKIPPLYMINHYEMSVKPSNT